MYHNGGRRIKVGNDEVGTAMDCPTDSAWVAGMSNYVLPQIAYHIKHGSLYAPRSFVPADIDMVALRDVAENRPVSSPNSGRGTTARAINQLFGAHSTWWTGVQTVCILRSGITIKRRNNKW